jgi:hypothetical protein
LARIQARVGADVTVFTTDSGVEAHRTNPLRENRGGVWVHFFPTRRGSRFFFCSSLLRACLQRIREFNIVHVHGLWSFPGTWGALAARWAHVSYIVSPQGMLNDWAIWFRSYKKISYWYVIERRTLRRAAWIHFATEEEQQQA